eukprot:5908373-Ditylum_brightwellii.AAC.1
MAEEAKDNRLVNKNEDSGDNASSNTPMKQITKAFKKADNIIEGKMRGIRKASIHQGVRGKLQKPRKQKQMK